MEEYIINDSREQSCFKGITFSKHNKNEVKKALIENISEGKIESACHWCAELICAGHFIDLWELILLYMSKYIHLGNPKIVFYLEDRYKMFKKIVEDTNYISIIELRNNNNMRRLFTEMFCVLCQSKKVHSIELIKINIQDAFDTEKINDRLKASSLHYLEDFFMPDDPKGLFIAINEFSYSISDSYDLTTACYWIEWIIEYECRQKKRKEYILCVQRNDINVDEQYQTDCVWVIWNAIIHYSKDKPLFVKNTLTSLLNLFCIKYTTAICKKRRYILYFAVGLLIESIKTDIEISSDKETLHNVVNKTNIVYKQLKQNEVNKISSSDSFNEKRKRSEMSIRKLDMLDGSFGSNL